MELDDFINLLRDLKSSYNKAMRETGTLTSRKRSKATSSPLSNEKIILADPGALFRERTSNTYRQFNQWEHPLLTDEVYLNNN